METHDQQDKDRPQVSGAPREGERPPADGGPAGDRRAVATSDPAVASGHGQGGNHGRGVSGVGKGVHPAQAPSRTRTLLFAGVVALVCGVAGAWGYSHFFGASKSGDHKPSESAAHSGNGSGSKKAGPDSGKGSDPAQDGDSAEAEGRTTAELRQARAAWLAAVKEAQRARASEKEARQSEEQAKAVLEFVKQTLLSGGRSGDTPLAEAFWAGGRGKDVTLRKALDGTEPQVAEAFADSPLAEAQVRELLGPAYLSVGEPAQAVKQYERALALREALQGANQPEAAACRNQLAVAYRLAGRTAEAARLFDGNPNSPAEASALAVRGSVLLREKKPAEAELKLRQGLNILEKTRPDDWTTFDAKSSLGEALLEQKKYRDAEPLLVSGYEGLTQREDKIPARDRSHVTTALQRLVRLYEAWGKADEAAKWRKELLAEREGAGPS